MRRILSLICILFVASSIIGLRPAHAENDYDMGSPILKEVWVDPVNGKDLNDGTTRDKALLTLNYAIALIQTSNPFTTTGYRVMLVSGTYDALDAPSTYNNFAGTAKYPFIFKAADGPGTVVFPPISASYCSYFYLIDIDVQSIFGQAVSFSNCNHVFMKNCTVNGFGQGNILAENVLTMIASNYCYVEDCTFRNSFGALDSCSSVHYGHIFRTTLDSAGGDGLTISSGSAYLYVQRNTITNVLGNGISLGGSTYLDVDFATPWLHYDCYDIRIDNNIINNCAQRAFSVAGSYNVLIAYNTFFRCGTNAVSLFSAGIGRRTCAGDKSTCSSLITAGAWGTLHLFESDDDVAWIPNKHVLIYNNLFYNPNGVETMFSNLSVWGSRKALVHATCPKPATADDDIQIKGNVLYNGSQNKPLGIEDTSGCQDSNTTCNIGTIITENTVNLKEPVLADPVHANFHPGTASFLLSTTLYPAPDFVWNDLPGTPAEPQGDLVNAITTDFDGAPRSPTANAPGALITTNAGVNTENPVTFTVSEPSINPASTTSKIGISTDVSSFVTISVFDMLGRDVATVAARTLDAGTYSFELPVATLTTGTYLVRISAEGHTVVRQLIVNH